LSSPSPSIGTMVGSMDADRDVGDDRLGANDVDRLQHFKPHLDGEHRHVHDVRRLVHRDVLLLAAELRPVDLRVTRRQAAVQRREDAAELVVEPVALVAVLVDQLHDDRRVERLREVGGRAGDVALRVVGVDVAGEAAALVLDGGVLGVVAEADADRGHGARVGQRGAARHGDDRPLALLRVLLPRGSRVPLRDRRRGRS
jgi:hypothetical protein